MTIESVIRRWEYLGDDVTKAFPYTNLLLAAADMQVFVDGVLQVAGFTVTNIGVKTGGNVVFDVAPAEDAEIVLDPDQPSLQPTTLTGTGDFDPGVVETALDRGVITDQQTEAKLGRQLTWPLAEQGAPDPTLPAKADRLGKTLGFDAVTGAPIALAPPAGTTTVSVYGAGLMTAADAAAARDILDAAPHGYAATPQSPATMVVDVAAGSFFNAVTRARVENAPQSTPAFVAPAVDPRNDIIHIDRLTGIIGVAAGAENAVPVDPAIPAGKLPLHRVRLDTLTVAITAAEIDDLRELELLGAGSAAVRNTGTSGNVVPLLDGANTWSAGQRGAVTTLTDAATIAVDLALNNNFTVTLAGNRTLGNPTNQVAGQSGVIEILQDGVGGRTLAYGADWKFETGLIPTLTTAINARDVLTYYVAAPNVILASLTRDWK